MGVFCDGARARDRARKFGELSPRQAKLHLIIYNTFERYS